MDPKLEALRIEAEENYAHARDHEQLRAQVTAVLVAAAFVLIGVSIDELEPIVNRYVAGMAIMIGVLNVIVVAIHNNRFDRHVEIARHAKNLICKLDEFQPRIHKRGSLSAAWMFVAALPIIGGCLSLALLGELG